MTLLTVAGLSLGLTAQAGTAATKDGALRRPNRRPNVILIITDDQGYGDLSAHGNPVLKTPHLDRLHAESARLTNFHVDPTCAPTRAALLTGRYSTRSGVWHTVGGRSLLARDETTLPQLFRKAGYRTALFGKWHLGDNYPLRPCDRGFDESLSHGGGGVGQTPDHWGNDYFDDTYERASRRGSRVEVRKEPQQGYCTDVWFRQARRWIEGRATRKDQPFFLYLAPNAPHAPYRAPAAEVEPYRKQGLPEQQATFLGMIANLDRNVGDLRQFLRESGRDRDTLLLFMTDNGTALGHRVFDAGMRAAKGSEYEGGHRVPCFVHWPAGGLNQGRDLTQLTAHLDLLPTLAELCRLPLPEMPLDGKSLVPLLRGRVGEWPERTLFVHSQRVQEPVEWKQSAVMTDRWRLINGQELYDLQADPGQKRNVALDYRGPTLTLRRAYETWWESLGPALRESVPVVVGSKEAPETILTAHDWRAETAEVPWDQELIRRQPLVNGWWELEVARTGTYRVTLRSHPQEAASAPPLDAIHARIVATTGHGQQTRPVIDGGGQQGSPPEVTASAPIDPNSRRVTLHVNLPKGRTRLQTWLTRSDAKSRGAFYVTLTRSTQRD